MHTRRDLFAGAGAIAVALGTTAPLAREATDPAVEVYSRWLPLFERVYYTDIDDDLDEALNAEHWSAAMALATARATTLRDLICQADLSVYMVANGELENGKIVAHPKHQTMWKDAADAQTIISMRNSLHRMAGTRSRAIKSQNFRMASLQSASRSSPSPG